MRTWICGSLASFAVVALALPAAGQNAGFAPRNSAAQPQQVPFTAEYKITRVRTLANGTTITRESTEVRAVDSQGRVMTARTELPTAAARPSITLVDVSDPATGTRTNWNVPGTKANVVTRPPLEAGQAQCYSTALASAAVTSPPAPVRPGSGSITVSTIETAGALPPVTSHVRPVNEDLGTETIDGVVAQGRRITRTTPVGSMGNDAPLVRVSETWTAKDVGPYGLVVRSMMDDPETGKTTMELVNLSLTEPEMSVFLPPEGYEIVTQEMHAAPCQTMPVPQR